MEGIKNKAYISENSIFANPNLPFNKLKEKNKYSELIWFSNPTWDEKMVFAIDSPQAFSGAGKLHKLENGKWVFIARRDIDYCNQETEIRREAYLENYEIKENIVLLKLSHLNDTLTYFKLDSSKQNIITHQNFYNQKYSIKGDFLKSQNYDSLIIKIQELKDYKDCISKFTLWNEKGIEIGNAPIEYQLDTYYPFIALNNSKEMIGIPFWGFIINAKQNEFQTKVLFNNKWEYFQFKKI
ncbi:MAG: hypothetical protein AB8H03_01030 [Saprospiraceae bacterium]